MIVPRLAKRACPSFVVCILATLGLVGCASGAKRTEPADQRRGCVIPHQSVNVVVTSDCFIGHVEPDAAVNPRNAQNLIGACQFELGPRVRLPGSFASFDGGRNWHDNGLLPLPRGFEQGADTTVAFDGQGAGFVVALMSHGGGGYPSRVSRGGIFLWRTRDGGRTFSRAFPIFVGQGFQDHPWLAVRRLAGASELFVSWTNSAGVEFSASRNGGGSFGAPRVVMPGSGPSDPVVTVGANSLIHVFFEDFIGRDIRLQVLSSSDDGAHFGRAETIGTVLSPTSAGGGPKGGLTPPPLFGAATDPSSGESAVAIAAQDPQVGHPVIELWRSPTTANLWQGPIYPVLGAGMAVAQEQPRLVFSRRQLYVSYLTSSRQGQITENLASASGGGRFANEPLSDRSFRASGFLGDYQALALSGAWGYSLWNDGRSGRLEIVADRFAAR